MRRLAKSVLRVACPDDVARLEAKAEALGQPIRIDWKGCPVPSDAKDEKTAFLRPGWGMVSSLLHGVSPLPGIMA